MAEIASVTLPDIPEDEHSRRNGFSTKLLGGEVTIMVDARLNEMKRCDHAKRLLLGMVETEARAGHTSHVVPYAEAACKVSAEEGAAQSEKTRHDKAVKNGKAQSKHLKPVNEERARQRPDYRPALKFASGLSARTPGAKPHGFWKELLTKVDAKHPGIFNTPEALRKAVCRADAERRGKHERTGKKRGRYHR